MTDPTSQRSYDLVLFGATGFTGRLVAEYLAERCRDGLALRWAMAGRDRSKLQSVQSAIGVEVPILVADAMDEGSMRLLAEQTRLVLTTVGPYAKYGSALVAACAAQGTDYCDLTGEVHWMRAMIDAHHETARRTGARIVHTCGYDSIPSDLGTLALFDHVERTHNKKLTRITHYAGESKGGVSGGTIASMLAMMELSSVDRSLRKLLANPYALNPDPAEKGPDGPDPMAVRFDDEIGLWTGPFVMAAVNSRVVRRSNALLEFHYGKDFRYTELQSTGRGATGLARASALTAGLGSFMVLLQNSKARSLLAKRVLPKPGEGPSRTTIEQGFFTSRFVGHGDGVTATLTIRGKRDPGYGATARMISESALCLLQDDLPRKGGVLTPASAMGMALVPRLERAGIRFEF
jgi:short subunit dehydrogenase-like uncharacterized protein